MSDENKVFFVCKVGDAIHISPNPDGLPTNCEPGTQIKVSGREQDIPRLAKDQLASQVKASMELDKLRGVNGGFVKKVTDDINRYYSGLSVKK